MKRNNKQNKQIKITKVYIKAQERRKKRGTRGKEKQIRMWA